MEISNSLLTAMLVGLSNVIRMLVVVVVCVGADLSDVLQVRLNEQRV